ncbi:MAG: acetyl-CoA hydrolase/transferase family protein, partial [Anaerolineae bacterium]
MPWKELYQQRLTTAGEAVKAIQSHQRVFLTGNCSVPREILNALVEYAPQNLENVEIIEVLTVEASSLVDPSLQGHLRVNSLFISGDVRNAVNEGRADFTPVFLSQIPLLYRGALSVDAALIQVSPPDNHGFCSFGVEVGVTKTAAEVAHTVIAEVNPNMPRTLGDSFIHVSDIDHFVEVDYLLPSFPMGKPSPIQDQIGQHIANLIEDGSTLQTGIGGIPDAVLRYLGDKKDLGVHTELFSDGVIDLVESGVINNRAKTIHNGKIIAGFVLGTQRLYDFVDDNPLVELHPTEYVNNPVLIAQNPKMVAINSAIEIDLTGQVCADSIGPRLYCGGGGQVVFMRGAEMSKVGKPI